MKLSCYFSAFIRKLWTVKFDIFNVVNYGKAQDNYNGKFQK